jgi:hypothetical protein
LCSGGGGGVVVGDDGIPWSVGSREAIARRSVWERGITKNKVAKVRTKKNAKRAKRKKGEEEAWCPFPGNVRVLLMNRCTINGRNSGE